MAPRYVDDQAEVTDTEIEERLVETAAEEQLKPWALVKQVADEPGRNEGEVKSALRSLTLRGDLTPTATGKIRATNVGQVDE